MLFQKIISLFLAILSFFASFSNKTWGDAYDADAFPQIGVTEKQDGTVRVCSFNIRCADVNGVEMKDRIRLVVQKILEIDPDSFGVQEATPAWMEALKAMLPDYGFIGKEREGDGTGESCAVFYKKERWTLRYGDTKWLSETPDEPSLGWDGACKRVFTYAALKNKYNGEEYIHINSHFDHRGPQAQKNGAKEIIDFVRSTMPTGKAIVFTADMNVYDTSEAYRTMTSYFADARKTAEDSVYYGTFHAAHPETHENAIIDYVLYYDKIEAKTFRVVTEGVDRRFVSDHFPIYADLIVR
ncbi:MAG: endonuclease/exonuclease/phosphatase family protein [Clostridia bacterium]|nr:endonuclease/exonuclease/phosphatase family protein [Clostridia bacterium]